MFYQNVIGAIAVAAASLMTLTGAQAFDDAALPAVSRIARAQVYPSRPVTMVIPFAAGSGSDVLGRILAPRLSETLGQQAIIENVGGAGGMIGSARVAK